MSAVLVLLPSTTAGTRELQSVRNAVNERARALDVSDDRRRAAVGHAFTLIRIGSSSAWAVAEACRQLAGKQSAAHGGYPSPPHKPVAA